MYGLLDSVSLLFLFSFPALNTNQSKPNTAWSCQAFPPVKALYFFTVLTSACSRGICRVSLNYCKVSTLLRKVPWDVLVPYRENWIQCAVSNGAFFYHKGSAQVGSGVFFPADRSLQCKKDETTMTSLQIHRTQVDADGRLFLNLTLCLAARTHIEFVLSRKLQDRNCSKHRRVFGNLEMMVFWQISIQRCPSENLETVRNHRVYKTSGPINLPISSNQW